MRRLGRWAPASLAGFFASLLLSCGGGDATGAVPSDAAAVARGYAHPERLVSAAWIEAHASDDRVRIIDLRPRRDYELAHIPGAAWLHATNAFQVPGDDGIEHQIPGPEQIAATLGSVGVTPDTTVIFYDGESSRRAARALWVLDVYGHADSRILDGGWTLWTARGLSVESDAPDVPPADYPAPEERDEDLIAGWRRVLDSLGDPASVVVDVRTPAEFAGADVRAARGGHVPGAVNVNWVSAAQPETGEFRPASELASLYRSAGVDAGRAVIVMCQSGARAAHTWFVLTYLLGYDQVRNYDRSWLEWGNRPDLPVER